MSDSLFDDPAFWLPQEILSDSEEQVMNFSRKFDSANNNKNGSDALDASALFPSAFPYAGFGGFGGSPVESSETESDEEEYLAGLSRQLAQSTLDDSVLRSRNNSKQWNSSGSPQSTLCGAGRGCGCGGQSSSRGSPNTQSPPATWDLLHAAAGEVAKMRIKEEALRFNPNSRGILGTPRETSPVTVPDYGFYLQQQHQQYLSHKHLQFQRLKQQQILKEQISAVYAQSHSQGNARYQHQRAHSQSHPMVLNQVRNSNNGPLGLAPSAWPALQQAQQQGFQPDGPGFRGVLVGAQKESTGTGVFLPRQIGTPIETPRGRKHQPKHACPAVFVPAKVVHALKMSAEEMRLQSQPQVLNRFNGRNNLDRELALRIRINNIAMAQQNHGMMRPQAAVNHEIGLPQEWTY